MVKTTYQCEYCKYSSASQKAVGIHENKCKSLSGVLASLRKEIALGPKIGPEFESRIEKLFDIKEKMKKNGS